MIIFNASAISLIQHKSYTFIVYEISNLTHTHNSYTLIHAPIVNFAIGLKRTQLLMQLHTKYAEVYKFDETDETTQYAFMSRAFCCRRFSTNPINKMRTSARPHANSSHIWVKYIHKHTHTIEYELHWIYSRTNKPMISSRWLETINFTMSCSIRLPGCQSNTQTQHTRVAKSLNLNLRRTIYTIQHSKIYTQTLTKTTPKYSSQRARMFTLQKLCHI